MRKDRVARTASTLAACACWLAAPAARADTWTEVAPMGSRRALYTLTVLLDGRALAAGGIPHYEGAKTNASAELFDPTTGAWAPAAPMLAPRFEHCAALLADGRVMVAGGQDWKSNLVTAEVFDPATGGWSIAASMAIPRYWCTATRLRDGRVLVAGGLRDSNAVGDAEIYDPARDRWTPAPAMMISRAMHTATLLDDGRVLVAGGNVQWNYAGARASAEIYDPASNAWSATGSLEHARSLHTATRLTDGRVLVAGGVQNDAITVNHTSVEIFDPRKETWVAAGPLRTGRTGHAAAALGNGRVLVAGGHAADVVTSAEVYNPVTNVWSDVTPMYVSRDFHQAALLPDGRVLVAGGSVSAKVPDEAHAEAEVFLPSTGTRCGEAADCPSGLCADGICCDTACDGACDACSRAKGAVYDGTCLALPQDEGGRCIGTESCVSAHDCTPPLVCDGAGRCVAPVPEVSDFSGCRAAEGVPRGAAGGAGLGLACAAAAHRRSRRRG